MNLKYIQILILTGVFALQFLFEHIYPQRRINNDWKNERFNLGIGLINVFITFLPSYFLVHFIEFIHANNLGLLNQFNIPFVAELLFTFAVLDAWMYIWHRLNHKLPFLWRFHRFIIKMKK